MTRYDRPRLIHETHVKKILEVPSLKNGSGNELRYLHDMVQQHYTCTQVYGLRAIRTVYDVYLGVEAGCRDHV